MAKVKHHPSFQWFFLALMLCAALVLQEAKGTRVRIRLDSNASPHQIPLPKGEGNLKDDPKRLLIGSVAPTCTYNECKGCKYKCKAEQVPVEGNDPINSAYHYKCVCQR